LTFGMVLVAPSLRLLAAKHPRLSIDMRLEDQLVDLVGEGVDVAIRAGTPPPDSTAYVAQTLFETRRVLVASPSWLKKHGTPTHPAQLARHDCLVQVTPAGTLVRWSLQRETASGAREQETVDVRGQFRTNAPAALRALTLDGLGVAYLPEWLVAEDIVERRLRRVLPEWSSVGIPAWAVYRAELRASPRIQAFLSALPAEPAKV
jgi:DNA-binding transcriptional LysR family regulator